MIYTASIINNKSKALLSRYSGASFAVSLRGLSIPYILGKKPVVRVRRSSDNAELDFLWWEVVNGDLVAWVGAGNDGFVTTWYDQSGNGNNATQATASRQPMIVDSGALVTGGISFDGVSHELETSSPVVSGQPLTFFLVANQTASSSYLAIGGDSGDLNIITSSGGNVVINGGTPLASGSSIAGSKKLLTGLANSTSSKIWIDGSEDASGNAGTNPDSPVGNLRIGNLFSIPRYADMVMPELIIYPSDASATRTAIETNIADAYGITL